MQYYSTRGFHTPVTSAQAILAGLAPDGGLYMPQILPDFDTAACLKKDPLSMATQILCAMLPDIPQMDKLVSNAYTGKFETSELTPTVPVGDFFMLELFRGPTSAFKDVALQMLPQLLTAAKTVAGVHEKIWILTATSGDTGKAALAGFQNVPGVGVCVFYPHGGVSAVQRAQMVTQEGRNVAVCAVKGNFDDAQSGVKEIFTRCQAEGLLMNKGVLLSSANSINIGRLAPQLTYYFKAYRDLVDRSIISMGQTINFSVPTGNFGDILAGFLAKCLGLPVGMLICASNANRVLTDFIRTGVYDRRRPLHKTISPSMDILVSSNLERLLYLLSGCDVELVRKLMESLHFHGHYTVPSSLRKMIQENFWASCCDDLETQAVIDRVWRQQRYLCDPHTAAGWQAAEQYQKQTGDQRPMVVLSTASPFKFPKPVLSAIGVASVGDEFQQMDDLSAATGIPIPKHLAELRQKPVLHPDVIEKEDMLPYVLGLIQKRSTL